MSLFISKYFTREEAEFSSLARRLNIDNRIPPEIVPAVLNTAENLDKIREYLQTAILVDSWYRCFALNNEVGSHPTSQHILGEAVDFISPKYGTPIQIAEAILRSGIDFDQLIYEYGWIHISWASKPGVANRKNVLTLNKDHKTYSRGIKE